ncbi:hypothetical protein PRVXH_000889 [Proteinivorax hydrogeniformans]|uniref:Uncharacterized protein n=1 Tax=Proteinivorax hydrogeniformans TaxID=1826727 RepID=A0AAU8HVY3_9FIRM
MDVINEELKDLDVQQVEQNFQCSKDYSWNILVYTPIFIVALILYPINPFLSALFSFFTAVGILLELKGYEALSTFLPKKECSNSLYLYNPKPKGALPIILLTAQKEHLEPYYNLTSGKRFKKKIKMILATAFIFTGIIFIGAIRSSAFNSVEVIFFWLALPVLLLMVISLVSILLSYRFNKITRYSSGYETLAATEIFSELVSSGKVTNVQLCFLAREGDNGNEQGIDEFLQTSPEIELAINLQSLMGQKLEVVTEEGITNTEKAYKPLILEGYNVYRILFSKELPTTNYNGVTAGYKLFKNAIPTITVTGKEIDSFKSNSLDEQSLENYKSFVKKLVENLNNFYSD